ncbi:MAG TPA: OsmC family protein [Anaerolineaceae bacterium]|nr:OsmC family protein [Anaerolineaceae bacterium]
MEAKVTWQGGMAFEATATTGFKVVMDSSAEAGGQNSGFRPTELLAMGTLGCTGMDVISILRKKKVDFTDFEVRVIVQSASEHPHVFTDMAFEYIVTGRSINRKDVERAVELSETKYCQCIAMMSKTANISSIITIRELE